MPRLFTLVSKALILSLFPLTLASVVPISVQRRASPPVVSLTPQQVDAKFLRPALFTRISYCPSEAVKSWKCGAPCQATPGVEVLLTGGDNQLVPRYFIAHDPASQSIVVAHQGTSRKSILSINNDLEFRLEPLDETLFPNAPEDVLVHDGFQDAFRRTANEVLGGIRKALADKKVNKVLVAGHSLGAAISMLDAMMLRQNLESSVNISTVLFGLPRAGNQAWADFVGAQIGSSFKHITNQNDPVPNLPPRSLGFQHPEGEVHIKNVDAKGEATDVVECPGEENQNCSAGNSILATNFANHNGPYFHNISFGGGACPS